jgi:membrane fusion protein (multidrug efflux system)
MLRKFVAVAALFALAACSREEKQAVQAAKPAGPISVSTAAVELRQVSRTIDVTGTLAPDEAVNLSAEVPGRVAAVNYDFGQFVKAGAVVAELDKQDLQFQLERSRASLAQALARVGLDPSQADEEPQTTPAIRQAIAQMEDAWSKFENAKKLVESGDISRERYDELEKQYRARQASVDAYRDEMRVQWANVSAMRAEVKLAEKRLRDATVKAPFDGIVSQRMVSPGQYVKDNATILTLVKAYPLRLRMNIPEVAVVAVRAGTELGFVTEAIPGKRFRAVVRELNASLDARSRSLEAEARLVNHDPALKPGMFVQVQLAAAHQAGALFVPENSVLSIAGLTKVFAVRGGKAVEVRVTPGQRDNGWVEVTGDLKPGDLVATSALLSLVTGAAVAGKG